MQSKLKRSLGSKRALLLLFQEYLILFSLEFFPIYACCVKRGRVKLLCPDPEPHRVT